jgi:hypothetical protein
LGDLARFMLSLPRRSGGTENNRNSATRPLKVRIPCGQLIRSAVTVAGIRGTDLSSALIDGSKSSVNGDTGLRRYFGALSRRNAAFPVFRETLNTRAISEIDTPSARCSLRISAQSSTSNTRFLLHSTEHRVPGELVNFHSPYGDQLSPAVDTSWPDIVDRVLAWHQRD